ncbi:MAG: hypothetical protein Q8N63_05320 [Nanoarchaeota archaeon]|nr:hypothetical protein [Nanoarchaeota archaeon]
MAKRNYIKHINEDVIRIHFADAGSMIENPFFSNSDRVKYDKQWRDKYANKHRPSACGGLGKALAKLQHPSSQNLGLREFNHTQILRVPAIEDRNFEEVESTENVRDYKPEDDGLYSLKTIEDERVLLGLGNQDELVYASCE